MEAVQWRPMKGGLMPELTQQRLRELLRYDPATGDFYWKVQTNARALVGMQAGKNSITLGYRSINVDNNPSPHWNIINFCDNFFFIHMKNNIYGFIVIYPGFI